MIDKYENEGWVCDCKVCDHDEPCICPTGYIWPRYKYICKRCNLRRVGKKYFRYKKIK